MTLAQKVLARASGKKAVSIGEVVTAQPDVFALIDLTLPHYIKTLESHGVFRFRFPERCVVFADHEVPAQTIHVASLKKKLVNQMRTLGITQIYQEGRHGISHQALVENGHVLPGLLVLGNDTHITTVGAMGAFAPPVNYEMVTALALGDIWLQVPETIRIELHGKLRPGVMSRDIAQQIAARLGADICNYRVIEYAGPAVRQLDIDARMTLCNVVVDMGAKTGVVEADEVTDAYLRPRARAPYELMRSDTDAEYSHRYEIDLGEFEPMVAAPPRPDNVMPVSAVAGMRVNQVYIGSCAGGRLEDLRAVADVLRGRSVHPDVRMLVVPTSQEIFARASGEGLLEAIIGAGAIVTAPSCGPCYGNLAPLVDGDVCIGTGTSNSPGRMGSSAASIYLSNAAVAAASAVAGCITAPGDLLLRAGA